MYALIYDEKDPDVLLKEVISVHQSRKVAEQALEKRQKKLGKRVWECDTRIVWIKTQARTGDFLTNRQFETWGPEETIPEGELYSDTD